MNEDFYTDLAHNSIAGKLLNREQCRTILTSNEIELMPLINAAFTVRKKFKGKSVTLHVIDNVENGHCSQDCQYCAQSAVSKVKIESYPMKTDAQIMQEAEMAYNSGAFRHCLVFSGKGPTQERIEHLAGLIKEMKQKFHPMQVCVSPGFINKSQAQILKEAGLDRLNHNLNTSQNHYAKICSTHEYSDRINTLKAAKEVGLQLCCGVIIGMGETMDDVIDAALTLRELRPDSLPVNYFLPIDGLPLKKTIELTPEYCLRVLCLYRFLNPSVELRVAAGREVYFKSLEALSLYPANSIFVKGYLNVKGSTFLETLQMIKDAGLTIESDRSIDELLKKEESHTLDKDTLKTIEELYPQVKT